MDFAKGQKAVAVAAVINKSRLQRRFNPHDFGGEDISFYLFTETRFKFYILNLVAVNDYDAGFLRLSVINQHSFHIFCFLTNNYRAAYVRAIRLGHFRAAECAAIRCCGGKDGLSAGVFVVD